MLRNSSEERIALRHRIVKLSQLDNHDRNVDYGVKIIFMSKLLEDQRKSKREIKRHVSFETDVRFEQ